MREIRNEEVQHEAKTNKDACVTTHDHLVDIPVAPTINHAKSDGSSGDSHHTNNFREG